MAPEANWAVDVLMTVIVVRSFMIAHLYFVLPPFHIFFSMILAKWG